MLVFSLFSLGFGMFVFYLLYKQVLGGMLGSNALFVKHLLLYILFFTGFLYLGYLTSSSLRHLTGFAPEWIGIVLFLFIGFKVYKTILQIKSQNWIYDTKENKVLFTFLLAHSFDLFIGGIALGFYRLYSLFHFIAIIPVFAIFLYVAYVLGKRDTATQSAWIVALLGCLLIAINSVVGVVEMIIASV